MPATSRKTTLHEGRYLRLVRRGGWEYVERVRVTGIVVIAATTADHKVVLIEQDRAPLGRRVIELPAGLAGDTPEYEGEALADAARRELLEETGYAAERLELLTEGPPSAGLSTEVVAFFRARGVKKVSRGGGDGTEDIRVHTVPLSTIGAWLERRRRRGLLIDPKVYTGLYFVAR